jgi:hypothetical protein
MFISLWNLVFALLFSKIYRIKLCRLNFISLCEKTSAGKITLHKMEKNAVNLPQEISHSL